MDHASDADTPIDVRIPARGVSRSAPDLRHLAAPDAAGAGQRPALSRTVADAEHALLALSSGRADVISLLEEFIANEGTWACQKILEAVRAQKTNPVRVRDTFAFNIFDVEILYPERIAILVDVINFWPEGTLRIDLDTFVHRLQEAV
ncbi:hypothetical protein [Massilia sp. SYSU DXS3249]